VYRYYSAETLSLDVGGMVEDLSNAPEGAVVLLHTTGHNPCGFDPSPEEWQRLAALCKVRAMRPCRACVESVGRGR
jgi:aspartate/tyrosine/aromatic aminotransferase